MFVLVTVAAQFYDAPLLTFQTHEAAFRYAVRQLGGAWFDIERIY